MRLLITGATGFIGSAVVREALRQGHEVAALYRPERPPALDRPVTWLPGDLASPPWEQIADFGADRCIHSAWIATPGIYLESPLNRDFVDWSQEFVNRCRQLGVQHVLALGTCLEYAPSPQPLRETDALAEGSGYARAKAELRRRLYADRSPNPAADLCWGRVFHVYGPGEHPARLCTSLIDSLQRGRPVQLKTPDSRKDFIYIDDLARAIVTASHNRFEGDLNFGSGQATSIGEVADRLARRLGCPELVQISAQPGHDPMPVAWACTARLQELGWRPQVELETGLERLLASLRPGRGQAHHQSQG